MQANNSAVFGLGPLGSWQVAIEGVWKSAGDGQSVKVRGGVMHALGDWWAGGLMPPAGQPATEGEGGLVLGGRPGPREGLGVGCSVWSWGGQGLGFRVW